MKELTDTEIDEFSAFMQKRGLPSNRSMDTMWDSPLDADVFELFTQCYALDAQEIVRAWKDWCMEKGQ